MSADTLNADLATLREELTRFLVKRRGAYPKREYLAALDRLEAHITRLTQERDEWHGQFDRATQEQDAFIREIRHRLSSVEALLGVRTRERDSLQKRAEAAEARCAQLQQALTEARDWIAEDDPGDADTGGFHAALVNRLDAALAESDAGLPDKPADSQEDKT